MTNKYQR